MYVPRGGPNGGDGGHGGDVVFEARPGHLTLLDFKYRQHFRAQRGGHGEGSERTGRSGEDLIVPVPPGTLVYDDDGGLLADLVKLGDRFVAAKGGRGGRGNARFATSLNRAPRQSGPGEPGVQYWLRLELRLLADVGLVGLPNVGKSTIISMMTRARPKIADYPFTTLEPNLGVVALEEYDPFVVADIPGLIEGASQGLGLGIRFLRHVERTSLILHVLDLSLLDTADPLRDINIVNHELAGFSAGLAAKPQIVLLNKTDLAPEMLAPVLAALRERGIEAMAASGLTGEGVEEVKERLAERLLILRRQAEEEG
jgi:GTP-binding protein